MTALLVNIRHVFYALSFPLHRIRGRAAKAYGTFALSDEAYVLAIAEQARAWSGARILWLQAFLHLYRGGGATLGAVLGAQSSITIKGLDFALTALFTVLAVDALRGRRHDLPTPVLARLSAVAARVLFPGQLLLGARMPTGVMIILLTYCLRDLPVTDPGRLLAPLAGVTVTGGLHLWRRNALLSILAGTATYVILTNAALT